MWNKDNRVEKRTWEKNEEKERGTGMMENDVTRTAEERGRGVIEKNGGRVTV